MPRKTDSHNPADWIAIAGSDMDIIRLAVEKEISFAAARSKLSEVLEKILKAELIRTGWELEKTHDLDRLLQCLVDSYHLVDLITSLVYLFLHYKALLLKLFKYFLVDFLLLFNLFSFSNSN